jgi:superfamily II DNA or RNA helicase
MSQGSLLSFLTAEAAPGTAGGAGGGRRGTQCDAAYHVPLDALAPGELDRHCARLTVAPIDNGFSAGAVEPLKAFAISDGVLTVPRFYGFEYFGVPETDARADGDAVDVTFHGALKELQTEAVARVLERLAQASAMGMLILPCGYGKTVCALALVQAVGRKTLVLVEKTSLLTQWQQRARTFLPEARVGKIQQDVVDVDGAQVVVGMIQSLARREYPADVLEKFGQFGLVIVDEAHHIAAPVYSQALKRLRARRIVGLTATPERRDGLTALLHWSMGSICHRVERQPERTLVTMIEYGGGARKEIKFRDGRIALPLMLNELARDAARNALIVGQLTRCLALGRRVIVLSDRISQLRELHERVLARGVNADDMAFYVGTTKPAERERACERALILSTYSMAKEGLDIPALDTLVLATPKGDVVQATGRVQRQHEGKQTPYIVDVVDTFSIFQNLRYKRQKFYRDEGFESQVWSAEQAVRQEE